MLTMVQVYIGLQTYTYKTSPERGDYHFVGCFWVGAYLLIPGIMGMGARDRRRVSTVLLISLIGELAAFSGIAVDGSAYALYSSLKACGRSPFDTFENGENYTLLEIETSGNSSYSLAAKYCAYYFPYNDCVCTKDIMNGTSGPGPDCYAFDGILGQGTKDDMSCDHVLETYPKLLDASFGICIVCFTIVCVWCALAFLVLFWPTLIERDYYRTLKEVENEARDKHLKNKADKKRLQQELKRLEEIADEEKKQQEEGDSEDYGYDEVDYSYDYDYDSNDSHSHDGSDESKQ
jgi:hypothetical protein